MKLRALGGLLSFGLAALASAFPVGADVKLADIQSISNFGNVGGVYGYCLGSHTCNVGTAKCEDSPRSPVPPARIVPIAPERYRIQLTVSRETHDRFRRAQALLRHAVPSGDAAEIFDRAITLLVERLESQRFAETARPRAATHASRCT